MSGWIGVDLDGTLAYYDGWKGPNTIGRPIPEMLARVKKWVSEGKKVKIMTARAQDPENIPYIELWLKDVGLGGLEVTNIKDFGMYELWDDRAVQVLINTGMPIQDWLKFTGKQWAEKLDHKFITYEGWESKKAFETEELTHTEYRDKAHRSAFQGKI